MIAWGLILNIVGTYTVSLGHAEFGLVAYAPVSDSFNFPGPPGLGPALRVVVGVGFVVIWVVGSLVILQTRKEP